ncbi:hypothetical protein [Subtercola sp. RTI3]|uniref:hypothetical protein n=1 Tax=Subtercola sp. RTI3 TaxID=3048639 RepID=UPI002B224D26|nr:hypothetical protein [Subtercola sp. RTI3]MEA9984882.1 hypothetical protein [Subtercola sp. RTI3]
MHAEFDESEALRSRIRVLEAIGRAQSRIGEVVALAAVTGNRDDLCRMLAQMLDITEETAHVVAIMSLERLATPYSMARISEELAELRSMPNPPEQAR